uniref:Uncharacterized protein n=1 Tax=Physcomitrium patens TaxID=3218 RepID=A0A2K1K5W3_PHYPA|nr:hypothetical protein PHYPA_011053 [Physcomitrium patens]
MRTASHTQGSNLEVSVEFFSGFHFLTMQKNDFASSLTTILSLKYHLPQTRLLPFSASPNEITDDSPTISQLRGEFEFLVNSHASLLYHQGVSYLTNPTKIALTPTVFPVAQNRQTRDRKRETVAITKESKQSAQHNTQQYPQLPP